MTNVISSSATWYPSGSSFCMAITARTRLTASQPRLFNKLIKASPTMPALPKERRLDAIRGWPRTGPTAEVNPANTAPARLPMTIARMAYLRDKPSSTPRKPVNHVTTLRLMANQKVNI